MDVGIAFDLKSDFRDDPNGPEDRLEEYDSDHTVAAIEEVLRTLGHAPRRLGGGRRFLERVLERPPAIVFNIAEGFGTRSREAHVPSVLEMLGIPVTHSDPLTCALTLDKAMAKKVVAAGGVPTARFAVVGDVAQLKSLDLRYPLIAKPACEGSSMGIRRNSRVTNLQELEAVVVPLLSAYHQPVLVEEFLSGPEFTVGILGNGTSAQAIGVMEIVPRVDRPEEFVYSLEVKRNYETDVAYNVPPKQPTALVDEVRRVALAAFRELGCRDVARVDIRTSTSGQPMFLEVNPLPGLNPVTGDIVILSRRSGVEYPELIERILDEARRRYALR